MVIIMDTEAIIVDLDGPGLLPYGYGYLSFPYRYRHGLSLHHLGKRSAEADAEAWNLHRGFQYGHRYSADPAYGLNKVEFHGLQHLGYHSHHPYYGHGGYIIRPYN